MSQKPHERGHLPGTGLGAWGGHSSTPSNDKLKFEVFLKIDAPCGSSSKAQNLLELACSVFHLTPG